MQRPSPGPGGHPFAQRIVEGARAELGAGFRPQGRGPGGLDCLGLIGRAARAAGIEVAVPSYPLRGIGVDGARLLLLEAGCRELPMQVAMPGDLLMAGPATLQVHFAIRTEHGLIEANALLRRVVERPLGPDERWLTAWRLPEGD